jgi:polyferredoxin
MSDRTRPTAAPTSRAATAEPLVEPERRPDLRPADDLRLAEVIPLPPSGAEPNLLHLGWLNGFLRSRWYPGIFQVVGVIVFAFIIVETLFGPDTVHDNPGSAIVWILWWPLLPLSYFVLARFWCTVCPFPVVGDLLQRFAGRRLPVPAFLKKYGIWIIDVWFIGITWADHVFGIVESPRGTGYLLLMILAGVVTMSVVFERRTFCRNLCFLGGLSGNYSMASPLALRANQANCKDKCRDLWCAKGSERAAACPMFETPRTMQSNRECNLCANCIKSCPHGSLRLELRKPTSEFWHIAKARTEVAFLAMILVGVVIIQNLTMLSVWTPIMDRVAQITGTTNFTVDFSVIFVLAMTLPLAALALASRLSRDGSETTLQNFARFGYAIIPLDLAAHMGHNLFHLFGEGMAVPRTLAELFGLSWARTNDALLNTPTIQVLQYLMLGAGAVATVYAAYRIARRASQTRTVRALVPHLFLICLLIAINAYMFTQPMSHRA